MRLWVIADAFAADVVVVVLIGLSFAMRRADVTGREAIDPVSTLLSTKRGKVIVHGRSLYGVAARRVLQTCVALSAIVAILSVTGCNTPKLSTKPGATSILSIWRPTSPEEAARWSVDEFDPELRYKGTLLLANAPFASEPIYVQLFKKNVTDEDAGVRLAAVRGLANHGGPENVPLIVDRLTDSEELVRIEAARGLQRVHNPVAIPSLIKAMTETTEVNSAVRAEAALALAHYPEPRVIEQLIANLDDPTLAVNRNTVASLRMLTGQDFGTSRRAWTTWYTGNNSLFAAQSTFTYPVFERGKFWYEYLPFLPQPPNEPPATPAGLNPLE